MSLTDFESTGFEYLKSCSGGRSDLVIFTHVCSNVNSKLVVPMPHVFVAELPTCQRNLKHVVAWLPLIPMMQNARKCTFVVKAF